MSQDRPTAPQLLAAVREWLNGELLPEASDARAFHVRVAANILAIVERELTLGAELDAQERERLVALLGRSASLEELNAELCTRIRNGSLDAHRNELLEHVKTTTRDKLRVANPKYK